MIGSNSFGWNGDGVYRVVNCPNLESIQIGDGSFAVYQAFELESFPSLQTVEIGRSCFGRVREWVLSGLDGLRSVVVGGDSFQLNGRMEEDGLLKIANCSNLESMEFGDGSFEDWR